MIITDPHYFIVPKTFVSNNKMDQQVAQIVGEQVLSVIQMEEARIDAELKKLGL